MGCDRHRSSGTGCLALRDPRDCRTRGDGRALQRLFGPHRAASIQIQTVESRAYSQVVSGPVGRAVAMELLAHLRRARDHIDAHYDEELDLDRLARVAGVSKYHFARSFEASYGETGR